MRLSLIFASIASIIFAAPALAEGPPKAIASIKPIHALLAGVMEGVATPGLLVPVNMSAHDYALKPSQAEQLR